MDKSLDNLYDVIVIGGGPAGLTSAIYLARARYRVLVIEKEKFGGQITITSEVVNYPGVRITDGESLTETMRAQAQNFGAEFLLSEAEKIEAMDDIKVVHTSRGKYYSFGIILASGAHPRKVGFKGEEEYKGRGVAYCATCDGEFFTDKDIFVIGGGFAAAEESVFLTKFAKHITILIREDDFTCPESVSKKAKEHEKITVITNTTVEEVSGENGLNYLRCKNNLTGEITEYRSLNGESFGVFVFAGYVPATSIVKDVIELDKNGYVITDKGQKTNIDGIYAAGDICVKPLRQVVTAVGDGALAATELERYASAMQQKTGLYPKQPEAKKSLTEQEKKENSDEFFTQDMKNQLYGVFDKMENPLMLKLYLDERNISSELERYITELCDLTDKLSFETVDKNASSDIAPCVKICKQDGEESGLAFHGVPGGHEFTSFVLGLYNVSGPGQSIEENLKNEIDSINDAKDIKVLVSLSCTMCPELVTAVQRVASINPQVSAEVYDISHFPEIKEKYNVMSVPCMITDNSEVSFGKKSLREVVEILKK